jgi:ATP adenylyltransferase
LDTLWAPWRMEYILADKEEADCFLCAARDCDDDKAALVVARSAECFVVLNKFPYNNGHLLIVPNRHEATLEGLTKSEMADMMALTVKAKAALAKVCAPQGFNIGINLGQIAGAGLECHIHTHIVPRWSGDTNFITSVASTKVIPQALEEMWQLLHDAWDSV